MKRLYKRVCPSIRPSVRPSVGMYVMLSLFGLLGATYAVYIHCIRPCSEAHPSKMRLAFPTHCHFVRSCRTVCAYGLEYGRPGSRRKRGVMAEKDACFTFRGLESAVNTFQQRLKRLFNQNERGLTLYDFV